MAARLRDDGYRARTVTLKVRLANFTTLTRSRTLPDATDVGADLYHVVAELYRALPGARRRVRLLGVQASGLQPAGAEQLALLRGERWGDVERTLDRIEHRFGKGAATQATLLDRRRERVQPPEPKPQRSQNPSRQPQVLPIIAMKVVSPRRPEGSMPLSDHEQRILDEIERRLAEDDPAFVEQVGRTDLYTHLARRIRLAVDRVRRRSRDDHAVRLVGRRSPRSGSSSRCCRRCCSIATSGSSVAISCA